MPFPNEHASRQKDPNLFIPDSFRRKEITPGISMVMGKLKSDSNGSMVMQSVRFDKEKFSQEEAKKWLKDHNMSMMLEPAKMSEIVLHDGFLTFDEMFIAFATRIKVIDRKSKGIVEPLI